MLATVTSRLAPALGSARDAIYAEYHVSELTHLMNVVVAMRGLKIFCASILCSRTGAQWCGKVLISIVPLSSPSWSLVPGEFKLPRIDAFPESVVTISP